jgi:hypothetical protein
MNSQSIETHRKAVANDALDAYRALVAKIAAGGTVDTGNADTILTAANKMPAQFDVDVATATQRAIARMRLAELSEAKQQQLALDLVKARESAKNAKAAHEAATVNESTAQTAYEGFNTQRQAVYSYLVSTCGSQLLLMELKAAIDAHRAGHDADSTKLATAEAAVLAA